MRMTEEKEDKIEELERRLKFLEETVKESCKLVHGILETQQIFHDFADGILKSQHRQNDLISRLIKQQKNEAEVLSEVCALLSKLPNLKSKLPDVSKLTEFYIA